MTFEISDYNLAKDAMESKNPAFYAGSYYAPWGDRTPDLGLMAHASLCAS